MGDSPDAIDVDAPPEAASPARRIMTRGEAALQGGEDWDDDRSESDADQGSQTTADTI
jgi:hypothetical protein